VTPLYPQKLALTLPTGGGRSVVIVVLLYSLVKQRLKCNSGKVCNCLIQFLLTIVLSVEERVFLLENLWPPCSPDLTPPDIYLCGATQSAEYPYRSRTLNQLKTAITAHIRNISKADLQEVFVNDIKWVQAYIDARGHHFQQLL
jgi:hypothetical protein